MYLHLLRHDQEKFGNKEPDSYISSGDTKNLRTSVALIALILREQPLESFQDFIEYCGFIEKRILAQSKGLLEIDFQTYNGNWSQWACRDIATAHASQGCLKLEDMNSTRDYMSSWVRWMHRSAFEYVFGESGDSVKFQAAAVNKVTLARGVLKAKKWLLQYCPIARSTDFGQEEEDWHLDTLVLEAYLQDIVDLASFDLDGTLLKDTHCALNEIYETLSLHKGAKMSQAGPGSALAFPDRHISRFLLIFWEKVFLSEGYVSAHLSHLEQEVDAERACFRMLRTGLDSRTSRQGMSKSNAYSSLIESAKLVLEVLHRIYETRTTSTRRTNFLISAPYRGILPQSEWFLMVAWKGPDCARAIESENFASVLFRGKTSLESMLWELAAKDPESWASLELVTGIRRVWDALQLFAGYNSPSIVGYEGNMRLRIMKSYNHWRHWRHGQSLILDDSFQFPKAIFRLVCIDRPYRKIDDHSNHEYSEIGFQDLTQYVEIYFDLSTGLSARLERLTPIEDAEVQSDNEESWSVDGIPWASDEEFWFDGTSEEMNDCLQIVVQEIWDDENGQLDAWKQLYLLACVRKWFHTYWGNSARERPIWSPYSSDAEV